MGRELSGKVRSVVYYEERNKMRNNAPTVVDFDGALQEAYEAGCLDMLKYLLNEGIISNDDYVQVEDDFLNIWDTRYTINGRVQK